MKKTSKMFMIHYLEFEEKLAKVAKKNGHKFLAKRKRLLAEYFAVKDEKARPEIKKGN
jgi:hypothetical protein